MMEGIHDVFPADSNDGNNPIFEKKLRKGDGQYAALKTILGFEFDGNNKTLWLEEAKREKLLTTLHGWIRFASRGAGGIPYKHFKTTIAKLRHAFMAMPSGVGFCHRATGYWQQSPKSCGSTSTSKYLPHSEVVA